MTEAANHVKEDRPLQSVAVIGAGRRGRSFALRCVQAGFSVVLEDVLSSNLREAMHVFAGEPEELRVRLQLATSVEDAVRKADIAVDFVPDELESKLEIFSMMDRMAPPRTIFCTPTELSITDLASCTYRPGLCLALKPFGDEIGDEALLVRGDATEDACVAQVTRWLEALGSVVRVQPDEQAGLLLKK